MARDHGKAGRVEFADLVPGHRHRTRDKPGRLGAPGHGQAVHIERAVTDDGATAALDDRVDHGGTCESLARAVAPDRQRQAERVPDRHSECARDVVGNDRVLGGEPTVHGAGVDTRGVQ